jgi:hypothetical protein
MCSSQFKIQSEIDEEVVFVVTCILKTELVDPLQRWCLSTSLHGATHHKTAILIYVKLKLSLCLTN